MKRDFPPGGPLGDPDAEVDAEIAFYLEERARELIEAGVPEAEARRRAEERFGDVARIEDEVRRLRRKGERIRGWRMTMGALVRDFRVALRGFAKRPGFSAIVVGTLALGIGAVTAIFTVVNAAMIRALPFEEADELVFVQGAFNAPEGPRIRGGSPPEIEEWRRLNRSFTDIAAMDADGKTLTGPDGAAERLTGQEVDEGYFEILRVTPLRGRLFSGDEYRTDAAPAVLIGEDLWERRFGRDEEILGRSLLLDDRPWTVVGVLPSSVRGTSLTAEYWVPLVSNIGVERLDERGSRWLSAVARLAPGVTIDAAQADMDAVTARLEAEHPADNLDRIAVVQPLREVYLGSTRTLLWVLLGAAGLLLVIASANVANLMLVRATSRSTETLLRRALGAGRPALIRHSLVESFTLTAAGAVGGVLLGVVGARLLVSAVPDALVPAYVDVRPDATVLVEVIGILAIVAVVMALAPVLLAERQDLAGGLRAESGRRTVGGAGRIANALVAGEVGLAILLLVGAGLMVTSLRAQLGVDPGFEYENLASFAIQLPPETYPDAATRLAGLADLESRLLEIPGVEGVTWGADAAPLRGGSSASYIWTNDGARVDDRIRFYFHRVRPGWFETLGVEMRGGRALDASDTGEITTTVISEAFAARHFAGKDPIGQSLYLGNPEEGAPVLTVVGVARSVHWRDITTDLVAGPTDPDIWITDNGQPGLEIVVRTAGEPAPLLPRMVEAVHAFDPDVPVLNPTPMSTFLDLQTAQARFGSLLLGVFSVLAATLAAVGLYGVLSFAVGRRRHEIAVRIALGADRARVQRMVVLDGLGVTAAGLAFGLLAAAFASRSLEAFLYAVEPVDIGTYVGVTALMAGVATLAAWLPARRATRTDPQRVLAGD
ncbi:MAG: ABC transporter permease [Longimicrobiales bacterium]|nr:ABC transporter permease [Longimicrobiales bacterium]